MALTPETRQIQEYHRFDPRRWLPRPPTTFDTEEDRRPRPHTVTLVFLNGRGSSGKDTQGALLAERDFPGAIKISTGDIVRGAQDPKSEYYRYHDKLAPYFAQSNGGGFIPDEEMLEVVQDVIEDIIENKLKDENVVNGEAVFIFTGFPRTLGQDRAINDVLGEGLREHFKVNHIHFLFDVPPEVAETRARNRFLEGVENLFAEEEDYDPAIIIRKDDFPAIVERRLKEFAAPGQTRETLEHRLFFGDHIRVVSANGSIEEVYARVHEQLKLARRPVNRLAEFMKDQTLMRNEMQYAARRIAYPLRKLLGVAK